MGKPRLREVRELVQDHPAGTAAPAVEAGGRFTRASLVATPSDSPSCIQSSSLATGPWDHFPLTSLKCPRDNWQNRKVRLFKSGKPGKMPAFPRDPGTYTLLRFLELHSVAVCPTLGMVGGLEEGMHATCAHAGHGYTFTTRPIHTHVCHLQPHISPMCTQPRYTWENPRVWAPARINTQTHARTVTSHTRANTHPCIPHNALKHGGADLLGCLTGLSTWSYSWLRFLQPNDTKQNQQKEKVCGVKSRGSQVRASKNPLPSESHRMHLILPASNCDNTM